MKRKSYRQLQNTMLLLTVFVLTFSFYMEFIHQLKPCPLCLMQRFCAVTLGLTCVVGFAFQALRQVKIIALIQCIIAILGLYFSGRQLWLQSLPVEQAVQCMPGLDVLMHYFSWPVILKSFFWGTSDCSQVDWRWFGISIPIWSGMYFVLIFLVTTYLNSKLWFFAKKKWS